MVTVPELAVRSSRNVSVRLRLSAKSPAAAGLTAAADTATRTGTSEMRFRVAVTRAALPGPRSEMPVGVSFRVTSGGASSSALTTVTETRCAR